MEISKIVSNGELERYLAEGWLVKEGAWVMNGVVVFRAATAEEEARQQTEDALNGARALETDNKSVRAAYMDAYRKYQAAVNYGEFEPVPAMDGFIAALRDKEWEVLKNVPLVLKYFMGGTGLAESGLIKPKTTKGGNQQ